MNNKDKTLIPPGPYCYIWKIYPSKKNNYRGKTKCCPFFIKKIINNVSVPWCEYLSLGGIDNNWNEKDWEQIRAHYKSEEEMDKELPLFLLFDQCKECGENNPDNFNEV